VIYIAPKREPAIVRWSPAAERRSYQATPTRWRRTCLHCTEASTTAPLSYQRYRGARTVW